MININKTRQQLLTTLRQKALSLENGHSSQLISYRKSHQRYTKRPYYKAELDELLDAATQSQIIYMGDFHSFDQSSKNFNRLLKKLLEYENGLVLGIEFIHHSDQEFINSFISNEFSELEFLQKINYQNTWRFPWKHYRTFFDLAKEGKVEILALNSIGTLSKRDEFAAQIMTNYSYENPSKKLLVLFGEYHITPNKLPNKVIQHFKLIRPKIDLTEIKQTIIHQNLDEVYLKQLRLNDFDNIIKFNDFEFSLQNSPAWIKYESMIYWYENISEDPDFSIHEYLMDQEHSGFSSSANEQFLEICDQLIDVLKLTIDHDQLEDFNLYGFENFDNVISKIEELSKSSLSKLYKRMVVKGKTLKLPLKSEYYCSSYSINRLSFLAGIHLHYLIQNKLHNDIELLLYKSDASKKFLYFCYQSMFAYLSSKIINPFRKCNLYQDIIEKIESKDTNPKKVQNLRIALMILDQQQPLSDILKGKSIRTLYSSAKTVGNLLADNIYDQHFNDNDRNHLLKLLDRIANCHYTGEYLYELISDILPKKYHKQSKRLF